MGQTSCANRLACARLASVLFFSDPVPCPPPLPLLLSGDGKWNQYSITLCKLGEDVSDGEIEKAKAFFSAYMSRWLIGIEWGEVEGRKHMQCVAESECFSSAKGLNAALRNALGWKNAGKKSRVCVKSLAQTGLHTFHGIVGYCMKWEAEGTPERPFQFFCEGVTAEDIRLGKDEYIRLGKPNKHCVSLTPNNIIDKAHMFCSMKLRGVYAPEFDKVIGLMLSTRKYILGQEFARPNAHLDIAQTALVWKARTNLPAFTGGDLGQALYGNPWRSYRYYNDENPDIMRVPMVERDDFYDCVEDFPAGAEAEDEFLTPEDANAQHDSFQDARGDEEEGEDIGTEDSPRSVEEEGEADDGWEDDEGVMLVADAALPPVTPGGWRATRD